ncbi:MAG TPA: hypothetical protein ENO02_07415 [Epsilonproteobacteria bacterium]|nr:hypothetical protein [Campylobacterota bacterium]
MNEQNLQKLAQLEQRDITQASRNGNIYEYISERAMEIQRDEDGGIEKIVFSIGGPNVWLDFKEHPGFIIAALMYEQGKSAIPWADWDDIQSELEEL